MKEIYFNVPGAYSDKVLVEKDPYIYEGCHRFVDILGREYKLPVGTTMMYIEEWDNDIKYIPTRYHAAIEEMKGKETGIIKK